MRSLRHPFDRYLKLHRLRETNARYAVCFPRSSVDHERVISEYYICEKKAHTHNEKNIITRKERRILNFSKGKLKVITIKVVTNVMKTR